MKLIGLKQVWLSSNKCIDVDFLDEIAILTLVRVISETCSFNTKAGIEMCANYESIKKAELDYLVNHVKGQSNQIEMQRECKEKAEESRLIIENLRHEADIMKSRNHDLELENNQVKNDLKLALQNVTSVNLISARIQSDNALIHDMFEKFDAQRNVTFVRYTNELHKSLELKTKVNEVQKAEIQNKNKEIQNLKNRIISLEFMMNEIMINRFQNQRKG